MALSADKQRLSHDRGIVSYGAWRVTNAQQIFAGALVGVDNSTGLLVEWADTANFRFLGVAAQNVLGDTVVTPPKECTVNTSGLVLEQVSVTGVTSIADVGDLVYATDDDTFTKTATANVNAIGQIARFYSGTTVDVRLFTPDEYRAFVGA